VTLSSKIVFAIIIGFLLGVCAGLGIAYASDPYQYQGQVNFQNQFPAQNQFFIDDFNKTQRENNRLQAYQLELDRQYNERNFKHHRNYGNETR